VEYGLVQGVRKREYFDTRNAAEEALTNHRKDKRVLGDAWSNLDPRKRQDYLSILREIKEHNTTLEEVWGYFKEHGGRRSGITVSQAVGILVEHKKQAGARPLYLRELHYGLNQFAKEFGDWDLASVHDDDLRGWLDSLDRSPSTKKTLKQRLSSLFAWAVRNKYVDSNPVNGLETIREEKKEPEILTVNQCKALVEAARAMDTGILAYLALALFMGLRPLECRNMEPDKVNVKRRLVTVTGSIVKTRDRRIVDMTDPAWRILSVHGLDYKVNFDKRFRAVRKAAKIKHWPHDVLRHTAASHYYNMHTIDEATKQLGHSADTMLKHYRALVDKEETAEWLRI